MRRLVFAAEMAFWWLCFPLALWFSLGWLVFKVL